MNIFAPKQFLNVSGFALSDIFEEIPVVWEAISKIEKFVKLSLSKKLPKRNVFVGKGTVVEKGAFVKGPAIIGKNCFIAHGAYIRENVIIGNNVNFGAGAITANFRLDGKNVFVRNNSLKIDSKLLKFGAIVGDGTKIGVGAVLNPGTVLGKNCVVYPLINVFGLYTDNKVIKK